VRAAVPDALEKKNKAKAREARTHHLGRCACRLLELPAKRFDLRSALDKLNAQ
jgi:hypothetical protein